MCKMDLRIGRTHYLRIILLITLGVVSNGCSMTYTQRDSVVIPGDATGEEKVRIAQRIATQVWESGIQAEATAEFPNLTAQELQGLAIRWNVITSKSLGGGDEGVKSTVSVECSHTSGEPSEISKAIVAFCKEHVQEAVDVFFQQSAPLNSPL